MSTELTSPLLDLVRRAGQRPGSGTAEREKQKAHETALLRESRVKRGSPGTRVLLCDFSGSMIDLVSGKRKHEHMRLAVEDCVRKWPGIRIVAFSHVCMVVKTADEIPGPAGGTALTEALAMAEDLRPERVVVITDGYPDNRRTALDQAKKMCGVIDVVYCGNDQDAEAIGFMQELAEAGCGRQVTWDAGRLALGEAVGMLMLEGA